MKHGKEILYVLKNEGMPGLIKIGQTGQESAKKRATQLYTTGVPFPFECLWAGEVENAHETEKLVHTAFDIARVNPNREFFKLNPEKVIPLLKKLSLADVTPAKVEKLINGTVTNSEKEATKQYRRPVLDFSKLKISKGSILVYIENEKITVEVVTNRKVLFEGKTYSLSALTKKIRKRNPTLFCYNWRWYRIG